MDTPRNTSSLLEGLVGDGRPLLSLSGIVLIASGAFALFLSATGHFLPHDEQFLGMTARELCNINQCRIVHFMFHDRTSFGGAIAAIGVLYLWLVAFPLAQRQAWAWWALLISGVAGFGSFLLYLGYGYLDTWHGAATLAMLPGHVIGLYRSRRMFGDHASIRDLWQRPDRPPWRTAEGFGRLALLATGAGLLGAGATICAVGATFVFVPQDLEYMGITAEAISDISPRLIPLIAHDRAGFGGAVFTAGLIVLMCAWRAESTRAFWQATLIAGLCGFSTAIGVHPIIGYTDFLHLAPAFLGAISFIVAVVFLHPACHASRDGSKS